MTKIINFDSSRKPAASAQETTCRCDHKYVTVYAAARRVNCAICGAQLDPFDVLLEWTKGYVPAVPSRNEERSLALEIVRRRNKAKEKENSSTRE